MSRVSLCMLSEILLQANQPNLNDLDFGVMVELLVIIADNFRGRRAQLRQELLKNCIAHRMLTQLHEESEYILINVVGE